MYEDEKVSTSEEHRHSSGSSIWVGIALVLLGIVFILQASGVVALEHWWALIILIPAIGSFGSAVSRFRRSGRFSHSVSSSISGGLFFMMLSAMFLFDLDWSRWWPVFIVFAGISIIMGGFARRP